MKRHNTKLIHEGRYVAEVDIELIETDKGWSPYLSLTDAQKLDDVRSALRALGPSHWVGLERVKPTMKYLPMTMSMQRLEPIFFFFQA